MRKRRRDWHGFVAVDDLIYWLLVRVGGSLLPLSAVFRRRIGKFVGVLHQRSFQFVFPGLITVDGDEFAADSGNGLQQELGEIAEGEGLFLGDAALRRQKKNVAKGAVDVGGGGEIAAERFEPFEGTVGKIFFALVPCAVMDAQGCGLIAASAAIGKSELAAR